MTLLQLKYFEVLARVLHFTRASQELNISQPSLSYAMNELEIELGVKLFKKDNRRIGLTVYGERFLPYVTKALSTLDDGVKLVEKMSEGGQKSLKIGYILSLASSLIPAVIHDIHAAGVDSDLTFNFVEDNSDSIFQMLHDSEIDIAFSTNTAPWAESVPVLRQALYLAVSADHPLAERGSVCLDDFIREPLVVLDKQSRLRIDFDEVLTQQDTIPNIAYEVHNCNAALQYVALNLGVSVLPYVPTMDDDRIVVLPIFAGGNELSRTIYASYLKGQSRLPEIQRVIDYIVENHSITL